MAAVPDPSGTVIIRSEEILDTMLVASVDMYTDITHRVESRITQYPVEKGTMAGDHIIREPRRLELTGWVSDIMSAAGEKANPQQPANIWGQILKLWEEVELLTVYTPLFVYRNMVITKVDAPVERGMGRALRFDIELTELVGKEVEEDKFPYTFDHQPEPAETITVPDSIPYDYGPGPANPYRSKGITLEVPTFGQGQSAPPPVPGSLPPGVNVPVPPTTAQGQTSPSEGVPVSQETSQEAGNAARNVLNNGGTAEEAAAAAAAIGALHGASRNDQEAIYNAVLDWAKDVGEDAGAAPPANTYVQFIQYNLHKLQKGPDADGKINAQITLPPNDLIGTLTYENAPATADLSVGLEYELEWTPYTGEWKMTMKELNGKVIKSQKINPDTIFFFNSNTHFASTRAELIKRKPNLPPLKPLSDRRTVWYGGTKYLLPPGAIYIQSTSAKRPFDFQAFSSNEYKVMWSP